MAAKVDISSSHRTKRSKRYDLSDITDKHVVFRDSYVQSENEEIEELFNFQFDRLDENEKNTVQEFNIRKRSQRSIKGRRFVPRTKSTPTQHRDTSIHVEDAGCEIIIQQDSDGDCILLISVICERRYLVIALVNLLCSPKHLQVTNNLFQNALHLAAIIGDHVMVRRLLVGGIEIDRKDRHGNTALHIACDRGFIKIADALLTPIRYEETKVNQYKAPFRRIPQNMEIRNFEGQTCLHVAAKRRDISLMELLLSKNADVNARYTKDGKTVLHHFCEIGDRKFVEFLMKRNDLDLNARSYSGTSAVDIAKCRGHNLIVSMILYSGAYRESPSVDHTDIEISDSDSE